MKRISLFAITCLFVAQGYGQDKFDFEEGDFETFVEDMKLDKQNYIIYYSATWCAPCKLFQRETLGNTRVVKYLNSNYLLYKVDIDQHKSHKYKYKITALPTTIVYNSEGEELYRFDSYVPPGKFVRELKSLE